MLLQAGALDVSAVSALKSAVPDFAGKSSVMEVLQCDGCDFRADSYDDLKAHIQDVHTAFLQPTAVGDQSPQQSRSSSLNSLCQAEDEEDLVVRNEYGSPHEQAGIHSFGTDCGDFSSSSQVISNQSMDQPSKSAKKIRPLRSLKCRYCSYTSPYVYALKKHLKKDHPTTKATAITILHWAYQDGILEAGYHCEWCIYSHSEPNGLLMHYQRRHPEHNVDYAYMATKLWAGPDNSASQPPGNSDIKYYQCRNCEFEACTILDITNHYQAVHPWAVKADESVLLDIIKGLAAHYQKRHDIDAYYTHCLAASKTLNEKPNKVVVPVTSQGEGPSLSEELRLAVERRKCSLCSFQAFSRKSIISHYIKRHPGVFPKRQHSSKLGRYFTMVYATEPEKHMEPEDKKQTEECPEAEQENDVEWLPFKCIKCFKLSFNTDELLCMHYKDYHSNDLKRDFTSLPSPAQDGMDCYQCAQCDLKFMSLPELSTHLSNHNDEFQKRAKRQERRKQLLNKQKGIEQLDSKTEKLDNHSDKAPIGYRCNFCVEVHPTLRAICNHLRKHVQYGEVKAGHVKQEVTDMPVSAPAEGVVSGDLAEAETLAPGFSSVVSQVDVTRVSVAVEPEKGPADTGVVKDRQTGGHPCNQCDRVFMSMQGLRSHERSHTAMAMFTCEDKYSCQYCHFVSPFRHNLDRHVQAHHGHHKPFRCKICSFKSAYLSRLKSHLHKAHAGENTYKCLSCPFSTMTISQLKEHSLKVHGEALTLPKLRAATQMAFRPQRPSSEQALATLESEESAYSEPPDVQQQLSHYQLAVHSQASSSPPAPPEAETRPEGFLTCEFCDFSSGYIQSLRRHCRDRHGGKKLFKCKDCSFFTCYKSTFTMHVEAGHSSVPEEGPKDLRCPLCLYHTKYKSNMIDHIVLHREERVVPLEVCRSKLSRHLQGVVFRCHKCTFTCSSDEALQLHIRKHDELKPYKCELCFYDSKQCEDLVAHLHVEHKVIRNFELVGRINLDQLEATKGKLVGLSCAEEEDEHEEEEEENMAKKPEQKGIPGSPCSSALTCSEKHFRCEFCGRIFTQNTEWERHVLRHGMTVANSGREVSQDQAIEAPAHSDVSSPVVKAEGDLLGSTGMVESQYPPGLAKIEPMEEEDEEMAD
ncbi:hypothetical protein AAFF_G00425900 [Aldrovandia affinis]|uniref:C2H2-type domain-containing protein n=1 Tax=Aldrovandia affinis TaxID=143900 RepID=A0AAD7T754_9TELE|nr:hypothetical protein AAFF_G00425900 [Aldrovandia affinis]